jgi:DNA-binding NtrC family response regulator
MSEKRNILVISGKESIWKTIGKQLSRIGYKVKEIFDKDTVLEELENKEFEVIILNSELPGIDAHKVIKTVKNTYPFIEVIVLAEHSTMRLAFDLMRSGAYDYLTQPFDVNKVILTVKQAVEHYRKSRNSLIPQELSFRNVPANMVGESSLIKSILDLVQKVAPTDSAVLIQGETGTGKGLVAEAIYRNSLRWNKPFVVVNCSAIPDTLLESELFGYEKGAFTGANRLKQGLLEEANKGTLFLDEVSEINISLQAKLLQVVETGRFRRLGSNKEIQVDLRIICATNRDLYKEATSRRFRKDLYYRLSVMTISVPSLKERAEDIPLLIKFFLENLKVSGKGNKTISPEVMEILKEYDWPGNIRELRNVIERAIIMTNGKDTVEVRDLPSIIQKHKTVKQLFLFPPDKKYPTLEEMEKVYIEKVLRQSHGHRSQAAKILGVTRHTLYNKIKQFRISERKLASFKNPSKK